MTTIHINSLTVNVGADQAPLPVLLGALSFGGITDETPSTEPTLRFVPSDDCSMVADTKTSLTWTKGNVGGRVNFAAAEKACADLTTGGHSDWRLPTREELESILDLTRSDPAIDPVFSCESAWYWTSTPYASSSAYAWSVYFNNGNVNNLNRDNNNAFVRAVRGPSPAGQ